SAKISGGKSPFKYEWNTPNANNEIANNLPAGDFELTVTDAAGNSANTKITITEPAALSASISAIAPASTNNADGKAMVKATGGSGKFSYQWDNGETTATAEKLKAANHSVTITDEAGCSTTATIEIGEDILPLAVELEQTAKINCAGENVAALSAKISGGKSPFKYEWNTPNANNEIANNLPAGDYGVTVTDAEGTTATAKLLIKAPEQLTTSITVKSPATTNQADGQAIALVNGGSGKYTFKWDNGETNATAKKLATGKHYVTVTDEAGCSTTASIDINEDIIPLKIKLTESAAISCAGENNAEVMVEVIGGKGPFEYLWSINGTKGNKVTQLAAGEYHVTITDATGTEEVANINITEPKALSISVNQDSPATANHADGKATVKVKGGSGKYSYRWSNGETTATAKKLALGVQEVTVTDSKGCSSSTKIEIDEHILPLSISLDQTATINCAGESTAELDVIVKGGKSPYKYIWNSEQLDGPKAVRLNAGKYMLTVTDASGLTKKTKIEITEPKALSAEIINNTPTTNEKSANGKASVKVKGGSPNYTYIWDTGATTASVENLSLGAHSVTVTDSNGCTTSLDFKTDKKILPKLDAKRLRTGQTLQVSRLYFKADSTTMTAESFPTLNEIADFLKHNQEVVIEIGGHTNNIPPHKFCDQLSLARAQAVADYIIGKGIDPGRIVAKGYGKRKPKFTNKTKDGREKNQRVEIKILSLE
ncbi:MAG TPA: hypothetical protein ENK52_02375, partial [Saprospiraceae bacterium]|nr:hypothetical protein [Saprospiraceae bacterium]